MVKNLPAVQETWVQSLSEEDPLEKGMQPTLVLLPRESHGQKKKKNPMDRRVWQAAVHGVAQSQTQLKRLSCSSSRRHS